MNLVFLSPHFPPSYSHFCVNLKKLGVRVLGIGDADYDDLSWELRSSLEEYYKVQNMEDYGQLQRALVHFRDKHGPIDRICSLNEHLLRTEACLRSDFDIPGIKTDSIQRIKLKSQMKKTFTSAGIPVARGGVIRDLSQAQELIKKTGFPVIAKPDCGVGASDTQKIRSKEELNRFWTSRRPDTDYILEEFIPGELLSFDGLTDQNGKPVFTTAHCFNNGIMETVNEDANLYYYSLREIPADLEEAGLWALRAFEVRESFFHIEFFRSYESQKIIALEINMRPPGGMTLDMFNYANDIDVYREWADVVANNRFSSEYH